jgi:cytochrome c biogenesis protein CcdA/thiol-disulfide isomerase/thioredoxin
VLPVLPVVLLAGATVPGPPKEDPAPDVSPDEDASDGAEGAVDTVGSDAEAAVTPTAAAAATATALRTPARVVRTPPPAGASPPARPPTPRSSSAARRPGSPPRRDATVAAPWRRGGNGRGRRSYRAYTVIAGLVLSFAIITLVGSALLSALDLPQDLLQDAGLAILGLVALGLLVPPVGELLERPFARLARHQPTGNAGGFVLGLGLGAVFAPCAGPVFSAISVLSATHHVGLRTVVLTFDFALGAAVPLLVFAVAGQRVAERVSAFRSHAALVRRIGGVVLLAMMFLIAFNVTDGLQKAVPGYTSVLQNHVEGTSYTKKQLAALTKRSTTSPLGQCAQDLGVLEDCGDAPNFQGVTAWLNTPGGKGLSLSSLRGKVVLVDFWTYSCINCQRSLPHVEAWYAAYHDHGLEVIGVHTPEFAFEHVVSNVDQAAHELGVTYPVAVDDDYKTWNAYDNEDWPAEYLIDAQGRVRHEAFGEGDYGTTESLIRQLLVQADPTVHLPRATDVPNLTPTQPLTPESYLGYHYGLPNYDGSTITPDQPAQYQFPGTLPPDALAFSGTWTIGAEADTAGAGARLELAFQADDVYLVIGGTGTVDVSIDGKRTKTIAVSGIPNLYTLVHSPGYEDATLVLTVSPGVQVYDFTFG